MLEFFEGFNIAFNFIALELYLLLELYQLLFQGQVLSLQQLYLQDAAL